MRKKMMFLMALMLTSALTIMAQITTSSMAGKVTFEDVKGEEVIGATIVAVHEPSGSRYTAVTYFLYWLSTQSGQGCYAGTGRNL